MASQGRLDDRRDGASGERAGVGEREVAPPFAAWDPDVPARCPFTGKHERLGGEHRVEQYLDAVGSEVSSGRYDRVVERRRAVALARHYREAEGLSIAQTAARLGRSPATVKAYFYDPTDANKGLSRERVTKTGGRDVCSYLPAAAARGEFHPGGPFLALTWLSSTSGSFRV